MNFETYSGPTVNIMHDPLTKICEIFLKNIFGNLQTISDFGKGLGLFHLCINNLCTQNHTYISQEITMNGNMIEYMEMQYNISEYYLVSLHIFPLDAKNTLFCLLLVHISILQHSCSITGLYQRRNHRLVQTQNYILAQSENFMKTECITEQDKAKL